MKNVISALVLVLFLIGCQPGLVYEKYFDVPDETWNYDSPISFEVEIPDANVDYNVYILIRHSNEYQFSNLWAMLYMEKPDSQMTQQRFELTLAQPDGKWNGSGFGTRILQEKLIRKNYHFENEGKYTFTIQHDMRINDLNAIKQVGLRIEKVKAD